MWICRSGSEVRGFVDGEIGGHNAVNVGMLLIVFSLVTFFDGVSLFLAVLAEFVSPSILSVPVVLLSFSRAITKWFRVMVLALLWSLVAEGSSVSVMRGDGALMLMGTAAVPGMVSTCLVRQVQSRELGPCFVNRLELCRVFPDFLLKIEGQSLGEVMK